MWKDIWSGSTTVHQPRIFYRYDFSGRSRVYRTIEDQAKRWHSCPHRR
jgi:hypothetical protein